MSASKKSPSTFQQPPLSQETLALHQKIIKDLETTFERALAAEQYSAALRAKELQLKEIAYVYEKVQGQLKRISDMTEEELTQLLG